jgi:hypothetical protein
MLELKIHQRMTIHSHEKNGPNSPDFENKNKNSRSPGFYGKFQ